MNEIIVEKLKDAKDALEVIVKNPKIFNELGTEERDKLEFAYVDICEIYEKFRFIVTT